MPLQIAKFLGTLWQKLDGWKTIIGLFLTLIGFLAGWSVELAAVVPSAALILKVSGILQLLNGLLHRGWKLAYGTEHP